MTDRKFYKTRIVVTVLSEEPLASMDLDDLHYVITDGDCSGDVKQGKSEEIDGVQAASSLSRQGSDPSFFNLTKKGEDADE